MNETCFFKDQTVYLKSDRLGRVFTVISNSTPFGITWCEDPITGITVALDTEDLALAPCIPHPSRLLAEALDDERRATHALGCWSLTTGVILVVAIVYYLSR